MQVKESSPGTTELKFRIIWLLCVHVFISLVVLAVLGWGTTATKLFAPQVGLFTSQACLLGIWVEAGGKWWWIRLLGCVVCVGWLGAPILVIVAAVAAVLFAGRLFGVSIGHAGDENPPPMRIQFSIRHLLLLTLVVACLTLLAKSLQPHLGPQSPLMALVGLPFAAVGLVACWVTLATSDPIRGVVVLFAVAMGVGVGMDIAIPAGNYLVLSFIIATLTQAFSLAVSLLIVRSSGYRLGRWASTRTASDPD